MGTKRRNEREVFDKNGTAAAAKRFIRATGRHVGYMDVANLVLLRELADAVDAAFDQAVTELHDRHGYSWAQIGRELGITRQAAQQRFGSSSSTTANVEVEGQDELFS
ncbi:MAG: hypothetical protein JWO22_2138 [Frankiales bacterium]|nr:hypothetical protein [Frankiales bacterium]